MFWKIIGIGAAALTTFSFLPQVIKIIKTRSVKDLSFFTLLQFCLGVSLWILYGIHLKDPIIICANTVTLLILITALILYTKYR